MRVDPVSSSSDSLFIGRMGKGWGGWEGAVRVEGEEGAEEGVDMMNNKRDKMKFTDFVVLFLPFL